MTSRRGRARHGSRLGFATVGVALALAVTGCGYDPSTAGNAEPPQGSAPTESDADVAGQRAAHLVADAEQMIRVTAHIQSDGAVDGEVKAVAGELRGIMEAQAGALDSDGGAAILTDGDVDAVLAASGDDAARAFGDLARMHVPRLQSGWDGLVDAGDPEIADVARDSAERLEALEPKVGSLPGR